MDPFPNFEPGSESDSVVLPASPGANRDRYAGLSTQCSGANRAPSY